MTKGLLKVFGKAGKLMKAYYHGLLPILIYLLFTAHMVGLHVEIDQSWFTHYLLLSWLLCYPLADGLEVAYEKSHRTSAQNVAIQWHHADLASQDKGSNWRVAHTRVSPIALKESLPSIAIGSGFLRAVRRFFLIVVAPALLIWQGYKLLSNK
ncbi:hypothetical protein [Levilactobacillus cerevisiae]|uniref:hypothetical protein n=1 Tax=Levilactobacillus cerevisiae TaxID=1704076 RepID=UPI000F7934AD|nr:hypothetical protein [Levilactobacillus cerevisiae]